MVKSPRPEPAVPAARRAAVANRTDRDPAQPSERNRLFRSVVAPGIAIAALAVLLAGGLTYLGLLERLDRGLTLAAVKSEQATSGWHEIPALILWLATTISCLALAWALLGIGHGGQRALVAILAVGIAAGWYPVMILAAYLPHLSGPWIAIVWTAVCGLAYRSRSHSAAPAEVVGEP